MTSKPPAHRRSADNPSGAAGSRRILITDGPTEGPTGQIAGYLAKVMSAQGQDVDSVDVRDSELTVPDAYGGVFEGYVEEGRSWHAPPRPQRIGPRPGL
jgi:hypothetical protein